VGVVLNASWVQMLDFGAGFMGLDPAGDDGHKYGYWPWQIEGWPLPTGKVFPASPVAGADAPKNAPKDTPKAAPKETPKAAPKDAPKPPPEAKTPAKPATPRTAERLTERIP